MSKVFGAAAQVGVIVHDIEKALKERTDGMGVGPWFYRDAVQFQDFTYRDAPCEVQVSVALANSAGMQFELRQRLSKSAAARV